MRIEDRICLPPLNLIHRRKRLLTLLSDLVHESRVIPIYAPSGYGKTTLLVDFAQTTDLPVCWCSLASADRDPTTFLTLVIHSFIKRFRDIDADALLALAAQGDSEATIRGLGEVMPDLTPYILIIDDYHKGFNAALSLTLDRLVDTLPEAKSIILSSQRYTRSGDVVPLPADNQQAVITRETLQCTPEEVQGVISKRFGYYLDPQEATDIASETDGNIAQILLLGHMTVPDRRDYLREKCSDYQTLIPSFSEIFDSQPAELRDFLLQTSLLPHITATLTNELLEIDDTQPLIDSLVKNQLFVIRDGSGIQYQAGFGEFLRAKLAKNVPLHRQVSIKTATLLAAHAYIEESVSLYLGGQAWDEAATLLEVEGSTFCNTGRALMLHDWLTQIPEAVLSGYPRLLLLRGQILCDNLGKASLALTYFDSAGQQFQKQGDAIGAAETHIWRSVVARMTGQAAQGVILAGEGLTQLEEAKADRQTIAWATKNYGLAHWTAGDIESALTALRQALEMFETAADMYHVGICHHDIGACLRKQGNIGGAAYHYEEAIRIWEASGNANNLANTLTNLGTLLCITGRYDEALQKFNDSLTLALQIGATRRAAFAQTGMGDTYLENGYYEEALAAYDASIALARQAEIRPLEIYNTLQRGECLYRQNNLSEALAIATQAGEYATELNLVYEKGLASALQGRIYIRQTHYVTAHQLFSQAAACLSKNDVLEQAKVRLWWAHSLLLDDRASAAFTQLQEALKLALGLGDLRQSMRRAVVETEQMLTYFFYHFKTPGGIVNSIRLLLQHAGRAPWDNPEPNLTMFSLGLPRLVVAGKAKQFPVRGRASKFPELIAYLVIAGQSRGRRWNEIAEVIWPNLNSDRASTIFHQSIRRLRSSIFKSSECIIVKDGYYHINPAYDRWCDALVFENLYNRISHLPPEQALPLQLELIDLYQGEFLAGFDLGQWGIAYRTRYERQFLEVIEATSQQLLTDHEARQALKLLFRGLRHDYFREELHQLVLRAYAELNSFSELRTHYETICRDFERDLGYAPSSELTKLYQQLIAGEA